MLNTEKAFKATCIKILSSNIKNEVKYESIADKRLPC